MVARRTFLAAVIALLALLPAGLHASTAAAAAPNWTSCRDGFQCATIQVPLDYANPSGRKIDLALIRLPASDSRQRIGSLIANPGGPGASGIDFVRAWADSLSTKVRDHFDIVGFDPRGIGASTPIDCHDNLQAYIAADPTPDNQAEWDQLVAVNRQLADACAKKYGDILPFLGTKNVARDLDQVRAAVGDAKLTYLGYSYGTVIGQVYADMFPEKVRAMVLDGAVDLSLSTDDRTLTQAVGFERALSDYAANCKQDGCTLARNNGDPLKAVDQLLAKAETAPIPARNADRPAGPGETMLGLITPLYSKDLWGSLTRAISAGLNGDGGPLVRLTDQYLERNPDGSYPNGTEAYLAVECVDQPPSKLPTDYRDYPAAAARFAQQAPHFGASVANGLSCAFWGAKPDPLSPPTARGAPPILVVDTRRDPATPYEWGVAVSKQLASGVLLTYYGEGHTAYAGGDSCVDGAVDNYLVDVGTIKAMACGDPASVAGSDSPAESPPPTGSAGTGDWGRGLAVAGVAVLAMVVVGLAAWYVARRVAR